MWPGKKNLCGLVHTSVLIHKVAYNPRLFAQVVESAAVAFLSIYIEAADSPCGNGSRLFVGWHPEVRPEPIPSTITPPTGARKVRAGLQFPPLPSPEATARRVAQAVHGVVLLLFSLSSEVEAGARMN